MKTRIQEMSTKGLKEHLLFWSMQTEKEGLLTMEDCSSKNSIVGQILTELELRNGEEIENGKEFDLFLMQEIKNNDKK
jgi:hypothetical protein